MKNFAVRARRELSPLLSRHPYSSRSLRSPLGRSMRNNSISISQSPLQNHEHSCNNAHFSTASFSSSSSKSVGDTDTTIDGTKEPVYLIHTSIPILDQLRIEEALLRADNRNFCIINHPPKDDKAIVLGISGKPELLVHLENVERDDIPLIKRFSGGGTVYTDERVVLVSFIFENSLLPDVKCFPRPIMDWTEEFYSGVIQNKHFALTENDYCVGSRKFGGNAQSITRKRWLHHTSFLWDFDEELFEKYLTLPAKRPDYRASRSHTDFLCRLKYFFRNHETEEDHTLQRTSTASQDYDVFSSPYAEHPFASSVIERLQDTFQKVERCSILEAAKSMDGKYHKSTRVLNVEDYQQ